MPVAARFWVWLRPTWGSGSWGLRAALAVLVFFLAAFYVAFGVLVFDVVYWLLGRQARAAASRPLRIGVSVAAGVACFALIAVAGQAKPSGAASTHAPLAVTSIAPFQITSHRDGDVVVTSLIAVEGTAPANAMITRDISMASDTHAQADDAGRWTMPVSLREGDNSLTFRIGDDKSTARLIHIIYRKPVATPHPTPLATLAVKAAPTQPSVSPKASVPVSKATPTATPRPTATPKPTATTRSTAKLAPSLGTRANLQKALSSLSGYSWESSPLFDGTPRSMAMSDDQHATCEIIGPDAAVTKADLLYVAGDLLGEYHASSFLEVLLDPSQSLDAAAWAENEITDAALSGTSIDKHRTFGNRDVEVMATKFDDSTTVGLIIVTPVHS